MKLWQAVVLVVGASILGWMIAPKGAPKMEPQPDPIVSQSTVNIVGVVVMLVGLMCIVIVLALREM